MSRVLAVAGRELIIREDHRLDSEAGCVVWDAGLCLVYYLDHAASLVAGKRVIELGCGPGAVGCTAAALGAESVVLTDLPHLLPLVRSNIEANPLGGVATAAALAWGDPVGHLQPPFDLVLASDVLYQAEALPLFVQTLAALSSPRTLTVLCNEHRPALPFPWQLFRAAGFEVRQVPLSEQHPEWSSEDIHLFHIRLACNTSDGGDS
ncbi:hypothetical protein CHLNCDRAFT_140665 [Chlorella variabilis]|uniref:Uncharacterized protein n=1 Tax=Chlorella variabilis TaxID=554065 RepID=E1Z5X4_CHLVA|nr:hypothetical protein CHLNCDRAFT_140665 [Chlorella variabilis]EFN58830.1 hypothetical protein CHLNCDRAFT_140665 [Chlorella variabilis]|eukprot:XP_005850932.1 hypothetical protein CHLNCDRAFT_140665 [Chlorella variabilis]